MGFGGHLGEKNVYHYHSNYDSHRWMSRFGDPGFKYHVAMAKVWGLVALQLSERPLVQFNVTRYALELEGYLSQIQSSLALDGHPPHHRPRPHPRPPHHRPPHHRPPHLCPPHHPHRPPPADKHHLLRSLKRLRHAIKGLQHSARRHDALAARLEAALAKPNVPWWRRLELWRRVRRLNGKYRAFDRAFTHKPGLDGRRWFKHVVYAPGKWTGYSGDTFPGLVESIREGNWTNAMVRLAQFSLLVFTYGCDWSLT